MIPVDVQSAIEMKHKVMFAHCDTLEKRLAAFEALVKQLTLPHQHELSRVCSGVFVKTVRNRSEQVKVNIGGDVYIDMTDADAIQFARTEIDRIKLEIQEIKRDLGEDVMLVDMAIG